MQEVQNLNSLRDEAVPQKASEDDNDVWQSIASESSKPESKPSSQSEKPGDSKPSEGQRPIQDLIRDLIEKHPPIEDRFERIHNTEEKKNELLNKTAREIAKSAAFDGTMSKEEKGKLADAIQAAYDMGCEKELIKAINSKLKEAGSKHRVFLDTRQGEDDRTPIRRAFMADRQIAVVNTDNGEVTDSHKFTVFNNDMLRPPIDRPWPRPRPEPIFPIDPIFPNDPPIKPIDPIDPRMPRLDPPGGEVPRHPRYPRWEPLSPRAPEVDVPDWMRRQLENLPEKIKKAGQ